MNTLHKGTSSRCVVRRRQSGGRDRGFTLIELLVCIGILGVLVALGLQGFVLYKATAAYAAADGTIRAARTTIAAAQSDADAVLPLIPLQVQANSPGQIVHPDGRLLMPGMSLPRNITLRYRYDPTCVVPGDIEAVVQSNHCSGTHFARWTKFCDGYEVSQKLPGVGCAP